MARLPQPGSDENIWGDILNEFLSVEHNSNGTLKNSGSLGSKYTKPVGGIPKSDLAPLAINDADIASDASIAQSKIQNLTSDLSSKADSSHTHDDRYYTETEVNNLTQYMVPIYILEAGQTEADLPGTFPSSGGLVLRKRS